MGTVIAHPPEQCVTTAKTSECQRAGHKKRGGGGPPPATLCVRAFSRESLDPPPGTGREPTSQVPTCAGPSPDHLPGAARYCVPCGWAARKPPRGAAPRCPACPAGVPISPEKWGERGPGPLSSIGGSVGTVAGWALQRGFPADSGGGARLSLEKVGGKNTRAPPWTRVFMAARSHSLVFGIVVSGTVEGLLLPISQDRFGTHFREKIC